MTDNIEVISRPKVRFRQFSYNARNKEIAEQCKEQAVVQANSSRVKKFVSLKKPIRVLDSTQSTNVCDKDISLSNCNIDTSSHYDITSSNVRNTSFSDKDETNVESTMILRDANGVQNIEKSCKMSQFEKSPRNDVLKDRQKNLRQKEKENKGIPLKRAVSSKNVNEIGTTNTQRVQSVTREKFKLSTRDDCMEKVNAVRSAFKGLKMTKSHSVPSITKRTRNSMIQGRILHAKPVTTLSLITSRYTTAAKNEISPVKKIVLRNVSGRKIKMSAGLGVFHKEQDDAKTNANERHTVASDVIVEDLTQPEYNSIMCTINKLKELEQQKIVTDVRHLPSMLKSFLNGKMSAALDFPLDEAIYKNLVDLSIDERQLPSTITRSKDPEPRQKDIVPKLSDFFIPEDTKEICEAVHVKSRASKIDDNWNAFEISDRILEWKYSIDDID